MGAAAYALIAALALLLLSAAAGARADVRVWTDQEERVLKGTLKGIEVLPAKPSLPPAPKTTLPPAPKPKPGTARKRKGGGPRAPGKIAVSDVKGLLRAIKGAVPGDDIVLAPGRYRIRAKYVAIKQAGTAQKPITVRAEKLGSAHVEFDAVEGFYVDAPYWVFENLDIVGVCRSHSRCEHAFHIVGRGDRTILRNNNIHEFNSTVKGNGVVRQGVRIFADNVLIEGNRIYNDAPRNTGNSVTLIDVLGGKGWVVRGNYIADFAKGRGNRVSYAAFLKGNSRDGIFERNLIVCEQRHKGGTRLGLSFGGGGSGKKYCENGDCTREHTNGIIRNNIIMNCPADVGIYLNKAAGTKIYNNTLYNTGGIDVRFETSTADIRNNIVSGRIKNRNGGRHTAKTNLVGVQKSEFRLWFKAPEKMDFSLKLDRYVVNKAEPLPDVTDDFCGTRRADGTPDIGAIEYVNKSGCNIAARMSKPVAAAVPASTEGSRGQADRTFSSLPANRWVEIHRSPERGGWLQRHSGAVFDSRRGRMLVFGSDTHDRPALNLDNAVHQFDAVTRAWSRHYKIAPASSYRADAKGRRVAGEGAIQPWAMHAFDALVYDPVADALVLMSTPKHNPVAKRIEAARGDPTWIYTLSSRRWRMLENGGKRPPTFFARAAAYDSHRDVIVAYGNGIWELGPGRDRWLRASRERHHTYAYMMEYDPRARKFLVFGDSKRTNNVWAYTPGLALGFPGTWEERKPKGDDCPPSAQFPVAYDLQNAVFLLVPHNFKSRRSVTCVYDPARNRYSRVPGADMPLLGSDENMAAMSYTMVYDSRRGVFLLVTGYRKAATVVRAFRLDLPRLLVR